MKYIIVIFISLIFFNWELDAQQIVKVLQPSMYSFLMTGHQISDTTSRYFFTSKESQHGPFNTLYMVDFNVESEEASIIPLLDTTQGQWIGIKDAVELFHIPLDKGDAIIGTNEFQCDLWITSISYITHEGEILWILDTITFSNEDLIHKIGFVASNVIAVIDRKGLTRYYDFSGTELFYEIPPKVYYNIIAHNEFYFGTRNEAVYKLNNQFDQIESYYMSQPSFLNKIDGNKIIVSSFSETAILDENLGEVAVTAQLTNISSVTSTAGSVWLLNDDGLYQLDTLLNLHKQYLPEPHEQMGHVWAYLDTVYVGSEFNGINHADFVIRKYANRILTTNSLDITLTSVYVDTVIREIINGNWQQLTFDSISFGIQNQSLDTISSFIINWDWKLFSAVCYPTISGENSFNIISIPPGQTRMFSFDLVVVERVHEYINTEFCFWIDYVNERMDSNPEDNMNCFEGTITKINEIQVDHDISLMPNPANEQITVESKAGRLIDYLSFYSNTGILVYSTLVSGSQMEVDVQDWPSGVYFLKAINGEQHESRMFIKQ